MKIVFAFACLMVAVLLISCQGLWDDMKGKSIITSVNGTGGHLSTSVNADGSITPDLQAGVIAGGTFSHVKDDGAIGIYSETSSTWNSANLGSREFKYACKNGVKQFTMTAAPNGALSVTIAEYEPTEMLKANVASFKDKIKADFGKNTTTQNSAIFETLSKARETKLADAKLEARRSELIGFTDAQLDATAMNPVSDWDGRLIGDEMLYRYLKSQLAGQEATK